MSPVKVALWSEPSVKAALVLPLPPVVNIKELPPIILESKSSLPESLKSMKAPPLRVISIEPVLRKETLPAVI